EVGPLEEARPLERGGRLRPRDGVVGEPPVAEVLLEGEDLVLELGVALGRLRRRRESLLRLLVVAVLAGHGELGVRELEAGAARGVGRRRGAGAEGATHDEDEREEEGDEAVVLGRPRLDLRAGGPDPLRGAAPELRGLAALT